MEICLVGGAVRDQLLGLDVKDRDWVVVGATPDQMRSKGFRPVGKDFPVFIDPNTGEEYALARTERKSGHGYQGFTFHTDPSVTLEEDLLRRDLTINAMAIKADGTFVDPYHGQQDIEARILRHVSPAFAEDPLRVLRVARFVARFTCLGFQVAPETLELMQHISASGELEHLTTERVWLEFERALASDHPLAFLKCLERAHALNKILGEFSDMDWPTTSIIMERLNLLKPSAEQRFALLCQLALENSHHQHTLNSMCMRLKAPNRFQHAAQDLHEWHHVLATFDEQAPQRRLEMIKTLKLLRQPDRLTQLLPTTLALHPDMEENLGERLYVLIEELKQVSAATWMAMGFKGKALGEAMEQEYLRRVAQY